MVGLSPSTSLWCEMAGMACTGQRIIPIDELACQCDSGTEVAGVIPSPTVTRFALRANRTRTHIASLHGTMCNLVIYFEHLPCCFGRCCTVLATSSVPTGVAVTLPLVYLVSRILDLLTN